MRGDLLAAFGRKWRVWVVTAKRFGRHFASVRQSHVFRLSLALIIGLVLALASPFGAELEKVQAAACQSNGTGGGNWNSSASWQSCGGTTPQPADTVTILNGDTITQNVASVTVSSLTINVGGFLVNSGSNNVSISNNYANNGTFTAVTGTMTFTATAIGKTITGNLTGSNAFYNLTFNGSGGGWSNSSAMEVINDLTMTDGTLSGSNNITVNGNLVGTEGSISRSAGTVEQRVASNKNFGPTGDGVWDFYQLIFSNSTTTSGGSPVTITANSGNQNIFFSNQLLVGKSGDAASATTTLNAGSRTWSANSCQGGTTRPFQLLSAPAASLTAGTSTFNYSCNQVATTVEPTTYYRLSLGIFGGGFVLGGPVTVVNNFVNDGGASVDVTAQNYPLTIGGNIQIGGGFNARQGTVTLNGTSTQTIDGSFTGGSSFYNLTITNGSGTNPSDNEITGFVPSINFNVPISVTNNFVITTPSAKVEYKNGSTYTFNNINWNGQAAGTRIYFRNSAASGSWLLNVSGTQTAVAYVNVSRSDASGGSTILADSATNSNAGNNTNWTFGSIDNPSSLGPTGYVNGSFGTDSTPSVQFTLSDPDGGDTVRFRIQIDTAAGFASPVVDYTSALQATGSATFTVGQAVGSGSYTAGSAGQTLTDGSYYWRVMATDNHSFNSSWVPANSGAVAFKIDTTAPTAPGAPSTTSPTTDTTPSWSWAASSDADSGLASSPYSVQWSPDSSFATNVSAQTVASNNFTHSQPLAADTWYFRVKAIDAVGNESLFSPTGTVIVQAAEELIAPPPADTAPPATPAEPIVSEPSAPTNSTNPVIRAIQALNTVIKQVPSSVPASLGLAVLLPTITLLVPIGSVISISLIAGLPAFQYLIFSLIPGLRPPRRWGTLRDRATNIPIPGVFVDLMNAATGEQKKRIMTDRTGRFGFLTPEQGEYWVEVKSALYEPYRTENFDAAKLQTRPISFDIKLTALEAKYSLALKKTARYMRFLSGVQIFQLIILIAGSILSVGLFLSSRSTETWLLIALYFLLWILRLVSSFSYRQSGVVNDKVNAVALKEAVVQVSAVKNGVERFIHSTITDEQGRFLVLVPPGRYSLIAAKGGYRPEQRELTGEIQDVKLNMRHSSDTPTETKPLGLSPST